MRVSDTLRRTLHKPADSGRNARVWPREERMQRRRCDIGEHIGRKSRRDGLSCAPWH